MVLKTLYVRNSKRKSRNDKHQCYLHLWQLYLNTCVYSDNVIRINNTYFFTILFKKNLNGSGTENKLRNTHAIYRVAASAKNNSH